MVELVIGIIFMMICIFILSTLLKPLATAIFVAKLTGFEMAGELLLISFMQLIFVLPFLIIAIFLLKKGIKKILVNTTTKAKGEICYGKILNVSKTGTVVTGNPELQAKVLVYVPSRHETLEITEVVGLAPNAYVYEEGKYVELKYYNDDINFERILNVEELPYGYKERFDMVLNEYDRTEEDIVMVDGVEYIKKDKINDYKNIKRRN